MMMTPRARAALAAAVLAALAAGCSSGAGFGSPPPYSPATPQPIQPGAGVTPGGLSPESSPTPETPLSVDSATARLAYDGSASDPVKAARLVEVTFALANAQASPMPVPNVAIATDKATPIDVPLTLEAPAGQDTVMTLVAFAPPKDLTTTKSLTLTFGDGKKLLLAQDTIDFPTAADQTMTPLDKKEPAGGVTLDNVSITSIVEPSGGLHFDLTFSITNASKKDAAIATFTVTPPKETAPKGQQPVAYPVTFAIPVAIAARTGMAPISIVVPYLGKAKTLPSGAYGLTATDKSGAVVAQGSGPLL